MNEVYDFEFENVKEFLSEIEANRVAIQLPDGLKSFVGKIGRNIEKIGVEVLFLSGSCYGSCDIADREAEVLGCDAIIQYGHSEMGISTSIPSYFVEARSNVDLSNALEEALTELEGSNWGLLATVQYVDKLEKIKDSLREKGIETVIGSPGPRCKYPGQILGCDWGSARNVEKKVDGFVYFGTGEFHPKGVALATKKKVISVNPFSGDYKFVSPDFDEFMRKRAAALASAESGNDFGILVSTKKGQNRLDLARLIRDRLEENGYESYLLIFDEIDPDYLRNYGLDVYVNTACPRIPLSDSEMFDSPILTPFEVMVLIGEKKWENYELDEFDSWGG